MQTIQFQWSLVCPIVVKNSIHNNYYQESLNLHRITVPSHLVGSMLQQGLSYQHQLRHELLSPVMHISSTDHDSMINDVSNGYTY